MPVGHAHNQTPVARGTRAASVCVAADNKRQISYVYITELMANVVVLRVVLRTRSSADADKPA